MHIHAVSDYITIIPNFKLFLGLVNGEFQINAIQFPKIDLSEALHCFKTIYNNINIRLVT